MTANQTQRKPTGFTLVELLVVIIIVAILSALTLGGLRSGAIRAKEGTTRLLVTKLSDAVMELLEELEDQGFYANPNPYGAGETDLYLQLPDSKAVIALHPSAPHPPFGAAYKAHASGIGTTNESAECLYMIVTQTGVSRSVIEALHAGDIGDSDGNGKNEFLDAWGNPIAFVFTPPELKLPPESRTQLATPRLLPLIRSFGVDGVNNNGAGDDIQNIYVPSDLTEPGFFMQ